ncbi:hypothetical protein WG909_08425 [Peptostreptococcaceae bacterium AGR-M142]
MNRANKLYKNINADMFITKLDNYDSEITLKGDCNMADNNMKIGSRRLTVKELEVLLKDYTNIYEQINSIRDNAWELKNKIRNDENYRKIVEEEPEFIKHHNNVFSILGTRGSGKSSILISIKYTIMNQIIKRKNGAKEIFEYDSKGQKISYDIEAHDTVLPIIAPQDMDEDSESLGWIIGFFEKEVEKSERLYIEDRRIFDYQNENCNLCSNRIINKNPLKESYDKLKEAYFKRKKDYKNRLMDVNSDSDYIELKGETLCQDVSLAKKFKGFIDEFVKYKSAVAKRKYNESVKEPLVFVFFDDVDISTKKCIDVLETIIRYLAHSNIVTFVSGNYKTFEETITLRYLEQDGLLDKELQEINFTNSTNDLKNNAITIRKKLTYDYLKKVLSPALRYHLTKIKDEDKYNFAYRIVEDENEEKTSEKDDGVQLYKLIEEAFGLDDDNFMKYELVYPTDEKKYEVMNKFFMPFDNKPRGLINIYYYLNSMWDKVKLELKKQGEDKKKKILKDIWTESELNKFLTIIITSNSRLDIYRKTIKDVIKIKKNYDGEIDVDVDYFQICEGEEFENIIGDKNTRLQVLILGLFFDGLISNLISVLRNTNKNYNDIFIQDEKYDEYKLVCDFLENSIAKQAKKNFDIKLIYKTNQVFDILYFYQHALNYRYDIKYGNINYINFMEYLKSIEQNDSSSKIKDEDRIVKIIKVKLIEKDILLESILRVQNLNFLKLKNDLKNNILKDIYGELCVKYKKYKNIDIEKIIIKILETEDFDCCSFIYDDKYIENYSEIEKIFWYISSIKQFKWSLLKKEYFGRQKGTNLYNIEIIAKSDVSLYIETIKEFEVNGDIYDLDELGVKLIEYIKKFLNIKKIVNYSYIVIKKYSEHGRELLESTIDKSNREISYDEFMERILEEMDNDETEDLSSLVQTFYEYIKKQTKGQSLDLERANFDMYIKRFLTRKEHSNYNYIERYAYHISQFENKIISNVLGLDDIFLETQYLINQIIECNEDYFDFNFNDLINCEKAKLNEVIFKKIYKLIDLYTKKFEELKFMYKLEHILGRFKYCVKNLCPNENIRNNYKIIYGDEYILKYKNLEPRIVEKDENSLEFLERKDIEELLDPNKLIINRLYKMINNNEKIDIKLLKNAIYNKCEKFKKERIKDNKIIVSIPYKVCEKDYINMEKEGVKLKKDVSRSQYTIDDLNEIHVLEKYLKKNIMVNWFSEENESAFMDFLSYIIYYTFIYKKEMSKKENFDKNEKIFRKIYTELKEIFEKESKNKRVELLD